MPRKQIGGVFDTLKDLAHQANEATQQGLDKAKEMAEGTIESDEEKERKRRAKAAAMMSHHHGSMQRGGKRTRRRRRRRRRTNKRGGLYPWSSVSYSSLGMGSELAKEITAAAASGAAAATDAAAAVTGGKKRKRRRGGMCGTCGMGGTRKGGRKGGRKTKRRRGGNILNRAKRTLERYL